MSFQPGDFVRLKTDHERSGVVKTGEQVMAGKLMIPVLSPTGQTRMFPAEALEVVPTVNEDLTERFARGKFVEPGWLRRMLTQTRVTGRVNDIVYSMHATNTEFYSYQFKPVLKLLNSPTDALLIADEVGLGKTIEAGLIWTELRARLDCRRLLVICPKTLRHKWRNELRNRFGVTADLVNASELHDLLEYGSRRGEEFAAIATLQGVMPPKNWNQPDDENADDNRGSSRRKLARFLDNASEEEPIIDLLVIDEAHHMRNPDTVYHQLGQLLNSVAAHRLFLSATPIHLRNRDLHSLLKLIDPDTFEYEKTLEDLINCNQPIVEARDKLLAGKFLKEEILELIERARSFEILSENRSLKLVEELISNSDLDNRIRSELAFRIEEANQMSNYMTRTRRRDVQELRIVREATPLFFDMNEDEATFYQQVTEVVTRYALECGANERFLLASPLRLLTSSPAAASRYWSSKGVIDLVDEDETDDDPIGMHADDKPLVSRLSDLARELDLSHSLQAADTKFNRLIEYLNEFWAENKNMGQKIIIFSEFKPTLRYLSARFKELNIKHELIHGDVKEEREVILKRFETDPDSRALLSSEVGSEGVDLQFCWVVVNYDLPWNPMRVEQRIGRVDRHGQKHQKISIVSLLYNDTIDAEVYIRLFQRLRLSENALGGFEAVLGEPVREMVRRLLDPELSSQQKLEAIDQAAQAAENMKIESESLEEQAGALIQHGDYVMQKINEARDMNRWLTERDVLVFVKAGLDEFYPGCSVEEAPIDSSEYRIHLTHEARDELATFVARKGIKFRTKLSANDASQRYKFTTSVVKTDLGKFESISQLHPLVRLIVDTQIRDGKHHDAEPVAARVMLDADDGRFEEGTYVVSIAQWDVKSSVGRRTGYSKIAFAGAHVESGKVLSGDDAEILAGKVAEGGKSLVNVANDHRLPVATTVLEDVVGHLDRMYAEFYERAEANVNDRVEIRLSALLRHRDAKSANLEEQARNHLERARYNEILGEKRAAQQFRALASAAEKRLEKLKSTVNFRIAEIAQHREITPEISEVAHLFVEVQK